MNSLWLSNLEIIMDERRADFRREIEQLRLEREATLTKPHQPGWIGHRLHALSIWMIAAGERMHRRYHESVTIPRSYQSFKLAR